MSNPHHNRAVFSDPISENETVLKLSSWMWMSGWKRMRRNARKRHSEKQIVYALRQVEGGKKVSETCREMGCVAGGGVTPGSGDTALGDLSAKLD